MQEELEATFSYDAFVAEEQVGERCRQLAELLTARLRGRTSQSASELLEDAVGTLRSLGHDLWSWDAEESWGWDYMRARAGQGLRLHLQLEDGEGRPIEPRVVVSFTPPRPSQ